MKRVKRVLWVVGQVLIAIVVLPIAGMAYLWFTGQGGDPSSTISPILPWRLIGDIFRAVVEFLFG